MRAFEMKHPALAQVDAYWEALRGDRNVPLRSEVDPRGIDKALENAFILERIAPRVARFRLAGMHLNDLMGMEVRGMPVTSLFIEDARVGLTGLLEHVFEQPAKARLRVMSEDGPGRGTASGEMILLPLRSDLGDISRALGCFVTDAQRGGPVPRRFVLSQSDLLPLTGRAAGGALYKAPDPAHAAADLKETGGGYGPAPDGDSPDARRTGAPHLRLVHDSDRKR